MAKEIVKTSGGQDLRRQAEEKAGSLEMQELEALSPEETRKTLHELRVHQIELEMQNEELRRAQEELDISRVRYFDLYDLAPVGYCTLSEKGLILEANLTAATLLGVSRGALVKQLLTRFILEENQDTYYLHRKQLFQTGEPQACEVRLVKKDGTSFWARLETTVAQDEGGASVCRAIISDITERKQVEVVLRESEERYRQLFESASDALFLIAADTGLIVEANAVASELYGYYRDELLTKKSTDLSAEPEETERRIHEAQTTADQVIRIPLRLHRKKDGTVFPVEITARSLTVKGRRRLLIAVRDITTRKRAEEALRESEERYRTIMDQAADAVFLHDESGRIVDVNRKACQSLGYSREELLFKSIVDIDPKAIALEKGKLWGNILAGEQVTLESCHIRKDGSVIPVEVTLSSVRIPLGPAIINISRDITERKQLEERIRQVRSDLLFAVSHDLKSPLQALHQTQEMLNMLTPGEGLARFQEYSEIWRRNLQRLERMINNLVDSQRTKEGRFPLLLAPSDPGKMVKRVVEDLTGYALASQVTFDLKLQPVPEGACDEEALSRVVENLLTNAVKFSPKGGKIEVRLALEDRTLLLEVEDHGLGIPANEQAQLFQLFQRGCSAQQRGIPGTGLGLYVCRRIVEEHGGTIALTGEEGKGTTVMVRLPWRD
ncbi:MAG: PAS domain S-box protein [Coprothermobacterota bacterium]|nr:PAS domain S-box protein [Coprothermobacterota bacterium]